MANQWSNADAGAGKVIQGLRQMGVTGDVHILLGPEDGAKLEAALKENDILKTKEVKGHDGLVTREWRHNNVLYRWPVSRD
jgi:hypothetical protein